MIRAPEYISSIRPYVPGKPIDELERELGIKGSIKLASNENPLGPSPVALEAMKGALDGLNRYPDGSGYHLRNALSKKLFVDPENIILGNGSNELLDVAVRTFMRPQDEAVMADPSFVVYSMAVQSVGSNPVRVPLKKDVHDLKAMLEAVSERTKMIFIANPNNPTGTINKRKEFDWFMERLPDGIFAVIDEAYYEYVSDAEYADSVKHFRDGKDILVLRTFSKIYGLAGIRIGYGIASKNIISEMNKVRQPFNTNSVAQFAALKSLEDSEHIRRSRENNEKGKKFLFREFKRLGLDHTPTEANFIYLRIKNAVTLYNRLLKKGVIIRPMGPDSIRVTIGLPEENKRFIDALKLTLSAES